MTNQVGELLKKTRLAKSLKIESIAEILKIRKKYLISLEEGNFNEIPGKAYIEGYIKLYSDYLGISQEIIAIQNSLKINKRKIIKVKKHINDNWILASIYAIIVLMTLYFIISRKNTHSGKNEVMKYLIEDNMLE